MAASSSIVPSAPGFRLPLLSTPRPPMHRPASPDSLPPTTHRQPPFATLPQNVTKPVANPNGVRLRRPLSAQRPAMLQLPPPPDPPIPPARSLLRRLLSRPSPQGSQLKPALALRLAQESEPQSAQPELRLEQQELRLEQQESRSALLSRPSHQTDFYSGPFQKEKTPVSYSL